MIVLYIAIIFLSALIHEAGHLLALTFFGARVRIKITAAGFVIERSGGILSYPADLAVSLSGPLSNLAVFALFAHSDSEILSLIGGTSLLLGIVNLIPIKKLDGGEALLALMSVLFSRQTAEAVVSFFSYVFIGAFFLIGICLLLTSSPNPTFFIMYLWLFYNIYIKNEKNK